MYQGLTPLKDTLGVVVRGCWQGQGGGLFRERKADALTQVVQQVGRWRGVQAALTCTQRPTYILPAHLTCHSISFCNLPAVPHIDVLPASCMSFAPMQPQIIFVGVYLLTKSGSQKPKPAEYDKVDDAAQQVCAVHG